MTENRLKASLGALLVALHLFILLELVYFRFAGGFDNSEFTTAFGIIIPMFSTYSIVVVGYIIANRETTKDVSKKVSASFSLTAFLFPLVFFGLIVSAIWFQAHSKVFESFEIFKAFVMLMESAFAVFIGIFIFSLFKN